jgi:hypothetical protein
VSTLHDGLFALSMNHLHSASHSGFSTHQNGNPVLAVKCAMVVSNNSCSPFDHIGSYTEKGAWCEQDELAQEWRAHLDGREDCVASENVGLVAQVDGTDSLIKGEYMGLGYGPRDGVDGS